MAFVTALPLSFYLGGFAMRSFLKIPVAGTVFTGIGALLVAVLVKETLARPHARASTTGR